MENKEKRLTIALTIAAMSISAGAFTAFADEGDVEISEANFPDAAFMEYVKQFDTTPDDNLSQDEIAAVKKISVSGKSITDLSGIEFFTAVTELDCSGNALTSLDLRGCTALSGVYCGGNNLTSLDLSGCTSLMVFESDSQTYSIGDVDGSYPLSSLPAGFISSKAGDWSGAVYDTDTDSLTSFTSTSVTYSYNCGNSMTMTVTLSADSYTDPDVVDISAENFPDDNFRTYVSDNFDTVKDRKLSKSEIAAVTAINVKNKNIRDLTGIEYFTALKTLNCNDNSSLTSLDVSKNTALTELLCISCRLASLDVSGCTGLTSLDCNKNELASLDVKDCTALTSLNCFENKLVTLDVSGCIGLKTLDCAYNQLTSLDVRDISGLTVLCCGLNQLSSLDVNRNTALKVLKCSKNQLSSLDVSSNTALTELWCENNQITSLDVSGHNALEKMECYNNQLESLNVSGCAVLNRLTLGNNQLTSLDLSGCTSLTSFACGDQKFYIDKVNISYPLSSLSAGFDSKKAGGWTGAEYDADTNSLKNFTSTSVTYVYDCGNGKTMNVTLFIDSYISPDDEEINEENFPDYAFRQYVYVNFDADHNYIMTKDELAAVSEIDVSDKGISDLKGIEYFTALTYLNCGNNKLESLDASKCTALTQLWCGDNKLKALNVSGNTGLEILSCGDNQLTELELSNNTALGSLSCNNNKLTVLDVSNNADLSSLNCDDN